MSEPTQHLTESVTQDYCEVSESMLFDNEVYPHFDGDTKST
jgi:hypothetical protein